MSPTHHTRLRPGWLRDECARAREDAGHWSEEMKRINGGQLIGSRRDDAGRSPCASTSTAT